MASPIPSAAAAALLLFIAVPAASQKLPPLPRERRLDEGLILRRDSATGELRYAPRNKPDSAAPGAEQHSSSSPAAIRVRVNLVEVSAGVFASSGEHISGLTRDAFRLFEDGAERPIDYFDASSEPARVALVLDVSPSVLREWKELQEAARALAAGLAPQDEMAVVAFAQHTKLLLPFTSDRPLLDRALAAAEVNRTEPAGSGSEIYRSVFLAAKELFGDPSSPAAPAAARRGRKAMILLTDGQDSGLGLSWSPASALPSADRPHRLTFEDVCRALASAGIEVYAVTTQGRPRGMTNVWLAANSNASLLTPRARELGWTHYTLYLAELVRRAGGQLIFLREARTLAGAWQRIAASLRAQYTLGFYPPAAGRAATGWHSLRVEVPSRPDVKTAHRAQYYSPAP